MLLLEGDSESSTIRWAKGEAKLPQCLYCIMKEIMKVVKEVDIKLNLIPKEGDSET